MCIALPQNPLTGTHPSLSPSPPPWQGHLWQQEPAHPRHQRSYPRSAPAEQQLLLAAGSMSCKRAGALHTHYPDAIHTLPSKAQGQSPDMPQPEPSQIAGSSGIFSITRGLKAPPGHSGLLPSPCSATNCSSFHCYPHILPSQLPSRHLAAPGDAICSPSISQHPQREPGGRVMGANKP